MAEKVSDREKEMARFAEMNPAPVIRLDSALRVISANPAAEALTTQLVSCGCPIEHHLPGLDREALKKHLREGSIGYQTITIDDHTYRFAIRGNPTEEVVHLYGSDITELAKTRRGLQEALAEQETLLASLAVGIAHVKNFRIVKVNRRWQEIFGYETEEEARGKLIDDCYPAGEKPSEKVRQQMRSEIASGSVFESEAHYQRKDGSLFWGRIQARAIDPADSDRGLIVAIEDFSERKKNEDELREAKRVAEEATKLKDTFVSLVTHDLRSPLATITGLLKTLEGQGEGLNTVQKEIVGRTLSSADRSLEMIESLLDISRLQTGVMTPQPKIIDIKSLATATFDGFRHLATQKKIRLINEITDSVKIYADINLLGEVLNNLVANAIKFTNRGDTITLFAPEKGGTLAVRDTGVGIDEKTIEHLFASEVKTTSDGTLGEKGTGLGLPLCHEIMEAHGGTLTVESVKGEGTTFYVTLPSRRPRLLLVDNDVESRAIFREALASLDVDFHEVNDSKTAWEAIGKQQPHMVIADAYLGEKEVKGFELLEKIKGNPGLISLPVVLVTKPECAWSREKAFALHADDIVTKPINKNDLLPRIKRFIDLAPSPLAPVGRAYDND